MGMEIVLRSPGICDSKKYLQKTTAGITTEKMLPSLPLPELNTSYGAELEPLGCELS